MDDVKYMGQLPSTSKFWVFIKFHALASNPGGLPGINLDDIL